MKGQSILKSAASKLNKALTQELRDQGHYLTGSLENSINNYYTIEPMTRKYVLRGFALDYAKSLNEGKGPRSKSLPTIEELRKYFILRGLSVFEATQAAFLTHRRHKKEGMPTKASSRFSKTGERKKFIERAWKSNEQKIDSFMDGEMDKLVNNEYSKQKTEII